MPDEVLGEDTGGTSTDSMSPDGEMLDGFKPAGDWHYPPPGGYIGPWGPGGGGSGGGGGGTGSPGSGGATSDSSDEVIDFIAFGISAPPVPPEPDWSTNPDRAGVMEGTRTRSIDETTTLSPLSEVFLSGRRISENLSTRPSTPTVLDATQMSFGITDEDVGWQQTPVTETSTPGALQKVPGIALSALKMTSTYVDPDLSEGTITGVDHNVIQYAHTPTMKRFFVGPRTGISIGVGPPPGAYTSDPIIGTPEMGEPPPGFPPAAPLSFNASLTYENPWTYDNYEKTALKDKFGFTAAGTEYPTDPYGAAHSRFVDEINDSIQRLDEGYSTRKDITRSTPRVNIFNNFEAIPENEVQEIESEEMTRVSENTVGVSTTTSQSGDYS